MAKAFIFSIDAFVAFTLVVVVIHSLVFLAALPSSYYGAMMQANYYARDTLNALVAANASRVLGDGDFSGISLLDYILMTRDEDTVRAYIGSNIPNQYGYRLELWDSGSKLWTGIYDTKEHMDDPHNKLYHKLSVSSHSIFFGYSDLTGRDPSGTPYCYMTCNPTGYNGNCPTHCDPPKSRYDEGNATLGLVRLTVYR